MPYHLAMAPYEFGEKITGLLNKPVTVGADYGARTRHLDLGKVALYQMS